MDVAHSRLLNLINLLHIATCFWWSHSCDACMIYCEYWYISFRLLSDVICHMQVTADMMKTFLYANFDTFCHLHQIFFLFNSLIIYEVSHISMSYGDEKGWKISFFTTISVNFPMNNLDMNFFLSFACCVDVFM